MFEFAPDMIVLLADEAQIVAEFRVSELLPCGFGPDSLPDRCADGE
jgi:cytidine deaminase